MNNEIVEALKALTEEINNLNKTLEDSLDIKITHKQALKTIQELRAEGAEQMSVAHKQAGESSEASPEGEEDLEGEEPVSLNDIITLNRSLQSNKLITAKDIQDHMKEQYETDKGIAVRRASELNGIQRVMLYKWMQQFNK